MDRISRKQRQIERKYDNLRRYAAQEEKYALNPSDTLPPKLSLSSTMRTSSSSLHQTTTVGAGTSDGTTLTTSSSTYRSESAEHRTTTAPGLEAAGDTRSVSADPIKRYHKEAAANATIGADASHTRSFPVVIAIQDYVPEPGVAPKEALPLEQGQIVEVLDNKNPSCWLVRTKAKPPQTGWVPGSYFETPSKYYTQRRTTRELLGVDESVSEEQKALLKLEQVYHDLLRTEEEFTLEIRSTLDNYVQALESETAPEEVKTHKQQLVLNLPALYNFHANVIVKGLQYYSDDPGKVGQTFVRLERDFEQHVAYMRELPATQRMIEEVHSIAQYLEEVKSKAKSTLKPYTECLQLVPNRVQQYGDFFKEIIKYCARAQRNTDIVQKALELVQSMPKRAEEIELTNNILNYPGDTRRLGRIYRHEPFHMWEEDEAEPSEKYCFLFKNKMMLTDRDQRPQPPLFRHYLTIRVDKYTVRTHTVDEDFIVFRPNEPGVPTFRLRAIDIDAREFVRKAWLKDITDMQQAIGGSGSTLVEEEEEE